MLQSISAIVSGIRDLSIGPSTALLASQMAPPSTIFIEASILIQALPSDATLWSNENLPYIMFNNLPRVLQERMKSDDSFVFPSTTFPTAYGVASALSLMQLVATSAYDQLQQTQAEFTALSQACSTAAPTTSAAPSVPVLLAPAGFPPVPTGPSAPAYVSQAETTLQRYQPSQQQQHDQPPPLLPYAPHHEPTSQRSRSAQVWPAPGWRLGHDPGSPPTGWSGCFYCFNIDHMFRRYPHRNDLDATRFFHWYIEQYVPRLWASI